MSDFDRYAGDYEEALGKGLSLSGEDQAFFVQGRVQWLAGEVRARGMSVRRILDFGCGTGAAVPFLHRAFPETDIVGIDVSEASLDVARERHGRLARFGTPGTPGVTGIDLAYCNGVFHHLDDTERRRAMDYVFSALHPGGVFALWENNPYNPGTRWVMSRIPFDRDARLLTAREVRAAGRIHGFKVLRTDYLFIFPRAFARLRPLEHKLSRLPIGAQYQVLLRKPDSSPHGQPVHSHEHIPR